MRRHSLALTTFAACAASIGVGCDSKPAAAQRPEPTAAAFGSTDAPEPPALILTIGIYTSDKPTEMLRQFGPIIRALEEDLTKRRGESCQIRLEIINGYDDAIQALVDGAVDFARFGPASYVVARERAPGVELLVIEEDDGGRTFEGVIFCRADRPFTSLADLRGASFAFGDELSTIGRYLAQAQLVDAGVSARDLGKYEFLGRHDRVAAAVVQGDFSAGSVKEGTYVKYVAKAAQQGIELRVLSRFPNVTKPWCSRPGLDRSIVEALRSALLSIRDPEVLKSISESLTGFGRVEDSEYEAVRRGMIRSRDFDPDAPR